MVLEKLNKQKLLEVSEAFETVGCLILHYEYYTYYTYYTRMFQISSYQHFRFGDRFSTETKTFFLTRAYLVQSTVDVSSTNKEKEIKIKKSNSVK